MPAASPRRQTAPDSQSTSSRRPCSRSRSASPSRLATYLDEGKRPLDLGRVKPHPFSVGRGDDLAHALFRQSLGVGLLATLVTSHVARKRVLCVEDLNLRPLGPEPHGDLA
jgi:hypothetical protein